MSFESDEKKLKKGMEVVEKLNFLSKAGSGISDDFRAHTIENLFGTVWTRPGLEIEERSMITLAGLIALNRENELRLHFRGARNLGFSREKLEEIIDRWIMDPSSFIGPDGDINNLFFQKEA